MQYTRDFHEFFCGVDLIDQDCQSFANNHQIKVCFYFMTCHMKLFSQFVHANLFSEWNALMCFLMLGYSLKVFSQCGQVKIPFLYVHKYDLWGFKLVQILVSISHIYELALTVSLNSHLITKWGIHVLLHARQDLTMCHTDIHHEFLQVAVWRWFMWLLKSISGFWNYSHLS